MSGARRLSLLVVASLLLAGCSGGGGPEADPPCSDCDAPQAPADPKNGIQAVAPADAEANGRLEPPAGEPAPILGCPDPCVQQQHVPGLWEPHAAGNPADPDHMVIAFRSARADGIETLVTRDGGKSWADGLVAVGPDSPSPVLRRYTHSGDASVAILADGTVLVSGLALNNTAVPAPADAAVGTYAGRGVYVARSFDGGLTFPQAYEVQGGGGRRVSVGNQLAFTDFRSSDKGWIAAGPDGTVLAAWTAIRADRAVMTSGMASTGGGFSYDVLAAVSRDAGATFGAPVLVEGDVTWAATHPAVGPDGAMAIAYGNIFGGELLTYTSPDGAVWQRHGTGTTGGQPVLLPGARAGELRLAYPALGGERTVPIVRSSRDGGATWGNATVLDGDIGCCFASVAFDTAPDGTGIAAWYDELPDGTLSFKARGLRADGNRTPMLVLASNLTGPAQANGDYVSAIAAFDGGGIVAWVAIAPDGSRSLQAARLAWGPALTPPA